MYTLTEFRVKSRLSIPREAYIEKPLLKSVRVISRLLIPMEAITKGIQWGKPPLRAYIGHAKLISL